jgi:hypothetical protein
MADRVRRPRPADGAGPPLILDTPAPRSESRLRTGSGMTIAALGIVYGDIGASPLYAVGQSLVDFGDLSEQAILGALSLIVWALVLIVTVNTSSSLCAPIIAARAVSWRLRHS